MRLKVHTAVVCHSLAAAELCEEVADLFCPQLSSMCQEFLHLPVSSTPTSVQSPKAGLSPINKIISVFSMQVFSKPSFTCLLTELLRVWVCWNTRKSLLEEEGKEESRGAGQSRTQACRTSSQNSNIPNLGSNYSSFLHKEKFKPQSGKISCCERTLEQPQENPEPCI